jgi:hypothetical protein
MFAVIVTHLVTQYLIIRGLRLLRGWCHGFLIHRSRFRRCLAHVVAQDQMPVVAGHLAL